MPLGRQSLTQGDVRLYVATATRCKDGRFHGNLTHIATASCIAASTAYHNSKLHYGNLCGRIAAMSARSPKPRGPQVARRVLLVTLAELGRVGLAGLSLPHVAELAGINKTSLYRRWPTKEALVTAALGLAVPSVGDLPDHGNLTQDLVALAGGLGTFMASPAGLGVLRTVFADGQSAPTAELANRMWNKSARQGPRVVLRRALQRGEVRDDTDLNLILYPLAGAVLHRIFVERKAASPAWAQRVVRLILEGVRPPRPASSRNRQRS
jgi:AcrR family transcriptional regulator